MSNRESTVAVNIDANVSGQESVADLTKRLDDMAKVLEGDLQAQAKAAADKLRELAAQQEAINTFERLKREATDAAAALKRAETEAQNFGQQIGQAGPPTAREAEAMQRLQAATDAARAKMVEQRGALAGAVNELQNYGIASKNTRDAQARLAAESEQVRSSIANLAPAYTRAASSATEAGAQIQRSHRAIGDGVESISTQLNRVQNAFVALQGGGFLGGLIKDAAETADAYNGLAARIKLATGEGNAFRAGMEGVQQIAVETRSSLEATGNLFTRLVTSGKDLGLTQRDALDLTKTINQAIQLTGGSAQAAEAAITQLSQGLQSGVLRGDEFNSVMEQSPRLARALADGLGVGIGKLREMAEQGQLTAETVVKALRGQSDTISSEFSKLPATVGGALQNLSTAWTVYVGNVDKSMGASKGAAEAINYLAKNLESIVGTVAEVGKGVAALQLLKLAAHFRDWAVGAAQATTAVTANTAATVANTVSTQANTAAKQANATASKLAENQSYRIGAAFTVAGAEAANAATKKGLLSTAIGGVAAAGRGLLGLIGGPAGLLVLTAAYAKDIGELTAKMVLKARGTKTLEEAERDLAAQEKRSYEQAQALAAARAKQAQADKDAAEAKFGLNAAAKQLITEFDDLIKKGQTADEAISTIGKKFDLASTPGIAAAAGVLDKLAADGKLSADQFQKAWATALDGKDLQLFEVMARTALTGAERSASQLAQALDGTLREAVQRAGLDMDVISGGMSRASVSAMNDVETLINGFKALKAKGADAGLALSTSFVKAIDTADSQRALDVLNQRIEASRKLLGDKITDGLLNQARKQAIELKERIDDLTPGINSVDEAMRKLGLRSLSRLKQDADEAVEAFDALKRAGQQEGESYVAWQARKEAGAKAMLQRLIEANNGVATEAIKTRAAIEGLTVEVDNTGRAIVRSMADGARAVEGVGTAAGRAAQQVRELGAVSVGVVTNLEQMFNKANSLSVLAKNIGKDGFVTDDAGKTLTYGGQLKIPDGYYFDAEAANKDPRFQQGLTDGSEYIKPTTATEATQLAAKKAQQGAALASMTANPRDYGASGYSVFGEAAYQRQESSLHVVNINLGGNSTQIETASEDDSKRLTMVMQELAAAARRAV